jgi:hypothetical protein
MLESTLLVDIGQLGDIFFPFMDLKCKYKFFNYIESTSKDPRVIYYILISGLVINNIGGDYYVPKNKTCPCPT